MTKLEMIQDILNNTTYAKHEYKAKEIADIRTLKSIKQVYDVFKGDKSHANFYWNIL